MLPVVLSVLGVADGLGTGDGMLLLEDVVVVVSVFVEVVGSGLKSVVRVRRVLDVVAGVVNVQVGVVIFVVVVAEENSMYRFLQI